MKNKITLYVFLVFSVVSLSHAQPAVKYTYDAAGNRTFRAKIPMRIQKANEPIIKPDTIIDKAGAYSFSFFPNPTSGKVVVEMEPEFLKKEVNKMAYLIDLNGRILEQQPVTSTNMPFDLSSYPFGIYILRVTSKEYSSEWRIVKQ